MSIEKITAKILNDAKEQAEDTLTDAKLQGESILEEASKKAEEIKGSSYLRGEEEKEKLISRRKSVADIDGRKLALEEKQRLIGICFEKAIEKIITMDEATYMNFLVENIKKTKVLKGQIVLNSKDRESIGDKLVKATKEAIKGSEFTLSEETRKIKGGFLLKEGLVYINGTVENIVEEAKDDLLPDVADKLFN